MNIELINKFLQNYKPGENLKKPDEKILEFGKQMLPAEIIYLWENYGFGDYGNGIIKIVSGSNTIKSYTSPKNIAYLYYTSPTADSSYQFSVDSSSLNPNQNGQMPGQNGQMP